MENIQHKTTNRPVTVQPAAVPLKVAQSTSKNQIQTAPKVSSPQDAAEKEADFTAKKIMRMTLPDRTVGSGVFRQIAEEKDQKLQTKLQSPYITRFAASRIFPQQKKEEEQIQRKVEGQPTATPNVAADIQTSMAGGSPLPLSVRRFMEPRFRANFGKVKIHTSDKAAKLNQQLNARAFTMGNHLFFGKEQFKPDSHEGKELIAHELTHTIQQGEVIQRSEMVNITQQAPAQVQRWGISDALNYFADKVYLIPGFRMLTLILGVNPLNMSRVERSAANILRALVEFIPGGALITQALDNYGIFDKIGNWVEQQIRSLGIAGSTIKQAITEFLDSLSWKDIFDLSGVWNRAKHIFTEPIARIINFAKGLATGILQLIKKAALHPLAKLAEGIRGYGLLKAVLGKDPVTGDPVPRTADTLVGGFMKLIGQEEVWSNLKKAKAVARAWAWFQGALGVLIKFVGQIPALFIQAFNSLQLKDIVLLPMAFAKIVAVFGKFAGDFMRWAFNQVVSLLEVLFSVVAPGMIPYIKKAKGAFVIILKKPITFAGNLVRAGKLGFQMFAGNILQHLKAALIKWIVGPLGDAGVYIPKSFSLIEIIKLVLSVLNLTWQNIRAKLVKIIPDPILKGLEKTAGILVTLVTKGPVAAWQQIKSELTELKDQLIAQVTEMVATKAVKAAVVKLASMLNPAGAVIQAIISIYNTISFFIEKAGQIAAVVGSFINSIAAIAAGQVMNAAKRVEQTMASTLTVVIAFLAKFAGLGNISKKIVEIIQKIRKPIDKGIDKIVAWLGKMLKKLGRKTARAGVPQDPNERLKLGMRAAVNSIKRLAGARVPRTLITPILAGIKVRYGFRELKSLLQNGTWYIEGVVNPKTKLTTDVKENLLEETKEKFKSTFKSGDLKKFLKDKGKISDSTAERLMSRWEKSEPQVLFKSTSRKGDTRPIMSFNRDILPAGRTTVRRDQTPKSDDKLIAVYKKIVKKIFGNDNDYKNITVAKTYRDKMRNAILKKYKGNLTDLNNKVLTSGIIPAAQNALVGNIFERWCQENLGVSRPGPIFEIRDNEKIKNLRKNRINADGSRGSVLVDAKVRRSGTGPNSEAKRQMDGYAYILDLYPNNRSIESQNINYKGPFDHVIYIFNDKLLIDTWRPELEARIGSNRVTPE